MTMQGYCYRCQKVRRVRVLMVDRAVPVGVCGDCDSPPLDSSGRV